MLTATKRNPITETTRPTKIARVAARVPTAVAMRRRRFLTHLLVGSAARSARVRNIARPESRRLWRHTYSFR